MSSFQLLQCFLGACSYITDFLSVFSIT